jgi:glycosyltransferase 2 family protein
LLSAGAWAATCGLVYFLVRKVLHLDFAHAVDLIRRAGVVTALIVLPYPIAMAVDTFTGRLLLGTMGTKPGFRPLYAIRLASEAVLLSLPVGTAFAESLSMFLLHRVCKVAPTRGIAFIVGKRWLLLRAHGVYVLLSGLLGYGVLAAHSTALIHAPGLPLLVLASTVVPFGIAAAMAATLEGGTAARAVGRAIENLPIAGVQHWIRRRSEHFGETDAALARVLQLGRRPIRFFMGLLLAAWLMDTVETWLILHVLGVRIGFVEVYSFEAGLSLVRSMAFFVPAGLGVQDLGYFAFFSALGVPDAMGVGAAFVLLKRTKELFWVCVGYTVLFGLRVKIARGHPSSGREERDEVARPT